MTVRFMSGGLPAGLCACHVRSTSYVVVLVVVAIRALGGYVSRGLVSQLLYPGQTD